MLLELVVENISTPIDCARCLHRLKDHDFDGRFSFDGVLDFLKSVEGDSVSKHQLFGRTTPEEFATFMDKHFGFDAAGNKDARLLMDQCFAALEASSVTKANVTMRDLLVAVSQTLAPEQADHLRAFFVLHDIDGNGDLDANELLFLLVSNLARSNAAAREILDTLADLDKDGNGKISVDEFKSGVLRSATMVNAIGFLFGVHSSSSIGLAKDPTRSRATATVGALGVIRSAGRANVAARRSRRLSMPADIRQRGTIPGLDDAIEHVKKLAERRRASEAEIAALGTGGKRLTEPGVPRYDFRGDGADYSDDEAAGPPPLIPVTKPRGAVAAPAGGAGAESPVGVAAIVGTETTTVLGGSGARARVRSRSRGDAAADGAGSPTKKLLPYTPQFAEQTMTALTRESDIDGPDIVDDDAI